MKIIDEKGRLFGKINIIDLLVVMFLLSLLPMFYFGYRLAKIESRASKIKKEFIQMEVPCVLRKIQPQTIALIKAGDTQVGESGKQIGEIISVGEAEPYEHKILFFSGDNKNYLITNDPELKQIPVKMSLVLEVKDDGRVFYNGQMVAYDTPFNFDSGKYQVEVVAIDALPRKWVRVKVRFSGLSPELSDIINNGHIEKDSGGVIIGRIDEILQREASAIQALKLEENKFVIVNDPTRRDLTVILRLFCVEDKSGLYFKNYPVKIGSQINFSSKLYLVNGTIVEVDLNKPKDENQYFEKK